MSKLIWFVHLWYIRGLYLMFKHRVVNSPEWKVTQSRIELAAPEGLLHSLLTSCLILIRMYRSEGAGRRLRGHVPLLCVWWLIMLSWQGEGTANGGESEGSGKCIKAPCSLWVLPGLAEFWSSSVSLSRTCRAEGTRYPMCAREVYHICLHTHRPANCMVEY